GHVRDLPQKGFGIDVENDLEPQYQVLPDKKEVIEKLVKAAKECDEVYLSPDPDREGEAIAWHIASLLPPKTKIKRASFNAITKEAVLEALNHPQKINMALVNAQQARRLLDRIVGYKISPILARKIQQRSGISAGRVQSVALKLVVDREKEIDNFKPVEYWLLGAVLRDGKPSKQFHASLYSIDGKRWEKEPIEGKEVALINNKERADEVLEQLKKASYRVAKVDRKEKRRNPEPPFITSTLQQEASRHFRFSASRTMSIAQTLYEGVDLDSEGAEGLITYMRTDSVRLAPEAVQKARQYIEAKYGKKYLPSSPRSYTTKRSAQDAHEAIRPTNVEHPPEHVRPYLSHDQYVLYELIWKRFIASQMEPAVYDTLSVDISTDQNIMLRATGSVIKFKGFLALYEEKRDEEEEKKDFILPPLKPDTPLHLVEVTSEQSFTKPPPRFTEALLVKELEKSGIGRPSTYASIMNKIQSREYTVKEKYRLKPTELGRVIAQFLEDNFQRIMNVGFTAEMEDTLEQIAANKIEWKSVVRDFWDQFIPTVETAEKEAFVPKVMTDIDCPQCGKAKLQKIWSKSRYFYGCSDYPECDFTTSVEALSFKKEDYDPNFNWDQPCPICGGEMKLRHGRYGPFLGCIRYPECKGIVNISKKGETPLPTGEMPSCPAIGCDGKMGARRSRFGKVFFSCSNYPDCDVIVNDLSQLSKKYPNHPKTPYQKKARKGRGGSQKKYNPSPELAAVIGEEGVTRGEATKKIWVYIKEHNLQNPEDKREIIPDAKLTAVFGSDETVSMFRLAAFLSQHLR
ncbi:MAG: type I DNA topoisomerase, partial [Chlamydiales bacterium]